MVAPDERLAHTPWWAIPAVREGRIVRVDGNLFLEAGPHIARAAATLAVALHPELSVELSPLISSPPTAKGLTP